MFLNLLGKNSKFYNHLSVSMPPNIGEPAKNARVIIVPRRMPTITNRLFIFTDNLGLNKKELWQIMKRSGRIL